MAKTGVRPRDVLIVAAIAILAIFRIDEQSLLLSDPSSDIATYQRHYISNSNRVFFAAVNNGHEILYSALAWLIAKLGFSYQTFVDFISVAGVIGYYTLARIALKRSVAPAIATAAFIISPLYSDWGNLLRQGLSLSFLLPAIGALAWLRWGRFSLLGALAIGCHVSAAIFLAFSVASTSTKLADRWLVFVAVGSAFMYASNLSIWITDVIVAPILKVVGLYSYYIGATTSFTVGFKTTFLLASAAVVVGSATVLLSRKPPPEPLRLISRLSLLITIAYMLSSGLPFYSRIATVSYGLFPIICIFLFRRLLVAGSTQYSMRYRS